MILNNLSKLKTCNLYTASLLNFCLISILGIVLLTQNISWGSNNTLFYLLASFVFFLMKSFNLNYDLILKNISNKKGYLVFVNSFFFCVTIGTIYSGVTTMRDSTYPLKAFYALLGAGFIFLIQLIFVKYKKAFKYQIFIFTFYSIATFILFWRPFNPIQLDINNTQFRFVETVSFFVLIIEIFFFAFLTKKLINNPKINEDSTQ